jgi:spore maturation protein CgeB
VNVVLAGDWHSNVHEAPMADALERLGHRVTRFAWHRYVSSGARGSPVALLRKAQNKYLVGPLIRRMNRELLDCVDRGRPDLLFVYRGTHVTRDTLEKIRVRNPRTLLVGYNNDDPFAPGQPSWPWRHFIAAVPVYDRVLAYRPANLGDLRAAGAKSTGLLLPWFVPSMHRPMTLTDDERRRYESDVVFVGHYEADGRLDALKALLSAGVRLRLFGPATGYRGHDWHGPLSRNTEMRSLMPVREVWDADYTRALAASRIALCFFSKRNRDRYTRRCFEIPATGTLLLSEYSTEMSSLFREGTEADFFRTTDELVDKVRYYLAHPAARDAVAARGLERVHRDGHDVDSRMRRMLHELEQSGAPIRRAV